MNFKEIVVIFHGILIFFLFFARFYIYYRVAVKCWLTSPGKFVSNFFCDDSLFLFTVPFFFTYFITTSLAMFYFFIFIFFYLFVFFFA